MQFLGGQEHHDFFKSRLRHLGGCKKLHLCRLLFGKISGKRLFGRRKEIWNYNSKLYLLQVVVGFEDQTRVERAQVFFNVGLLY